MKITDCHDMALKGEPTFTLLARDRTAPKTITTWADGRRTILCQEASARLRDVITDSNIDIFAKDGSLDRRERAELGKINAAYAIAQSMELWRGGEIDQAAKENREVSWRQARLIAMSPAPAVGEACQDFASLLEPKKADNFENESPIRAFTQFQVSGEYAIGKGFRPSLTHLAHYLDAMLNREAWELVQIILPENDAQDPTVVFRRTQPVVVTVNDPIMPELRKPAKTTAPDLGAPHGQMLEIVVKSNAGKEYSASGVYTEGRWFLVTGVDALGHIARKEPLRGAPNAWRFTKSDGWNSVVFPKRSADAPAPVAEVTSDDPLHPAHYGGDECMQIIEHMPTNVGIAVKYLWRLGKKDEPRQELGKAIEYLRRELRMARNPRNRWSVFGINAEEMADYKAMTRRHIAARFGPESDWQAITLHRLVHYTITGAADSVNYAIERIERAMSEMHDHGHGLAL